jgi:hypothetical protein
VINFWSARMSDLSHLQRRAAGLGRWRPSDDPDLAQAKSDLAEARLREAIQREAANDPPLTAEQRSRLAVLLLSPTTDREGV